jgi:hypothetical protein
VTETLSKTTEALEEAEAREVDLRKSVVEIV